MAAIRGEKKRTEVQPMAKRKYRVVFKKTSPLVKTVILIAVLISTIALVTLYATIEQSHSQYEAMRQQAGMLEETNQNLVQQIGEMGTLESIIQIAMERLGLVLPDTTIFEAGN